MLIDVGNFSGDRATEEETKLIRALHNIDKGYVVYSFRILGLQVPKRGSFTEVLNALKGNDTVFSALNADRQELLRAVSKGEFLPNQFGSSYPSVALQYINGSKKTAKNGDIGYFCVVEDSEAEEVKNRTSDRSNEDYQISTMGKYIYTEKPVLRGVIQVRITGVKHFRMISISEEGNDEEDGEDKKEQNYINNFNEKNSNLVNNRKLRRLRFGDPVESERIQKRMKRHARKRSSVDNFGVHSDW